MFLYRSTVGVLMGESLFSKPTDHIAQETVLNIKQITFSHIFKFQWFFSWEQEWSLQGGSETVNERRLQVLDPGSELSWSVPRSTSVLWKRGKHWPQVRGSCLWAFQNWDCSHLAPYFGRRNVSHFWNAVIKSKMMRQNISSWMIPPVHMNGIPSAAKH